MKQPLWTPISPEATNSARFIKHINDKYGLELKTYGDLHRWSVGPATSSDFWGEAYNFLKISPTGLPVRKVLTQGAKDVLFPPPRFFPEEEFNLAELLLRNRANTSIAIHAAQEGSDDVEVVTWLQLRNRVRQVYDALASGGLMPGDVVGAVISNSVDAIVLCLATLAHGAIWSSASCDLGAKAILDRWLQIKPKFVFAESGYTYAGKQFNLEDRTAEWSSKLTQTNKNLSAIVIIPCQEDSLPLARIPKGIRWDDFLRQGNGRPLTFATLPFTHPAFILFSSGTTGMPKCIVHSAGGVALKVKTDMQLQHDVRPQDVVFQYTTTGWVMWVFQFMSLSFGASVVIYDGSPMHPSGDVLWRLAEKCGVTVLGTSPRYLAEQRSRRIKPCNYVPHLRIVTSTGAVLSEELYEWFYKSAFPPKAHLISMSGGTDIAGCFVGGTPLLPVYPGEIQVPALGMAIDVFDASQVEPISVAAQGLAGELVCTMPFPSQPITFHGPDGLEKYRSSYFKQFGDGCWYQGDFVQIDRSTGGIFMLGRSDGVLNPSGVRFGSAEIYSVLEKIPEIDDSICVGQRRKLDLDENVLLFLKMRPGHRLSTEMINSIKKSIKEKYSPRHVPKGIYEVSDVPYTSNGKKCEIVVKQIVCGQNIRVSGNVVNPESLKLFEPYYHLQADGSLPASKTSKL